MKCLAMSPQTTTTTTTTILCVGIILNRCPLWGDSLLLSKANLHGSQKLHFKETPPSPFPADTRLERIPCTNTLTHNRHTSYIVHSAPLGHIVKYAKHAICVTFSDMFAEHKHTASQNTRMTKGGRVLRARIESSLSQIESDSDEDFSGHGGPARAHHRVIHMHMYI